MIRTRRDLASLALRTLFFFIAANVIFALIDPMPQIQTLSLYNSVFDGRQRFSHIGVKGKFYTVTTDNLDMLFNSHTIAGPKEDDEYRVIVLGDSTIHGFILMPEETVSSQLDQMKLHTSDGRRMRFYNLGYPTPNNMKDLVLLNHAMQFQPDMVLWFTTPNASLRRSQLGHPLVKNNASTAQRLIRERHLKLDASTRLVDVKDKWLERTAVGRRQELKNWWDLQVYGLMWTYTGIDQKHINKTSLPTSDVPADLLYQGRSPTTLNEDDFAFDVLDAGIAIAGSAPVIMINKPIMIATGKNSRLNYNDLYPRWVYDQYRELFNRHGATHEWRYLDLWDAIPSQLMFDADHLQPAGAKLLAQRVAASLQHTAP